MSCGRTENEDDNSPLPLSAPISTLCVRCKALPPTILIRSTGYCQDCFVAVFQNKFKAGFVPARDRSLRGSAKDVQQGKKRKSERSSVMIAFSGGQSSRTLLDLVVSFFPTPDPAARYTAPPPFATLEVVYVDESGLPGYGGIDRTEEVRAIVENAGLKFVALKIEDAFASSSATPSTSLVMDSTSLDLESLTLDSTRDPSATPLSRLIALLAPHTPTSRASLHASILRGLLRRTAVARGHEVLVTGETATRVAVKVLSGMAEGRGFNMGEEVGMEWENEEVDGIALMQIRPLSLLLTKEISYYCRLKNLESLTIINPTTGVQAKKAGIEALTEEFVNGLEAIHPSTVATIIRTAGKLGMITSDAVAQGGEITPCPLCGLPAQSGAKEWRRANTISSLDAARAGQFTAPTSAPLSVDSPTIPLASLLCYGCLLIYQDVQQNSKKVIKGAVDAEGKEQVELPPFVGDAVRRRMKMREEIGEYLLDE